MARDAAGLLHRVERPEAGAVAGDEDRRAEAVNKGLEGDQDLGGLEDLRGRRLAEGREGQARRSQGREADQQRGKTAATRGCPTSVALVRESEGSLRVHAQVRECRRHGGHRHLAAARQVGHHGGCDVLRVDLEEAAQVLAGIASSESIGAQAAP